MVVLARIRDGARARESQGESICYSDAHCL